MKTVGRMIGGYGYGPKLMFKSAVLHIHGQCARMLSGAVSGTPPDQTGHQVHEETDCAQ